MTKYAVAIIFALLTGWLFRQVMVLEDKPPNKIVGIEKPNIKERHFITPDAILTNIQDPSTTWIRLELSYVLNGSIKSDQADKISADLVQDTLLFLRTLNIRSLEGPLGLIHLREDLLNRAKVRIPDQSIEIYIKTMVIQ